MRKRHRFKAETSALNGSAELRFPSPIPESGVPGGVVLLVGVLIAGLAYGAWYVLTERDGFLAEVISPLPERFRSVVDSDDGETGSAQTPTEPSASVSQPSAPTDPPARTLPTTGSADATSDPPQEADRMTEDATVETPSASDEAPYPPPPLPGEGAVNRGTVSEDTVRQQETPTDPTSRAMSAEASASREVAANSVSSEDSDPSEGVENDAVSPDPVPQPTIAAASPDIGTSSETMPDDDPAERQDAGSGGNPTVAGTAPSAPAPAVEDINPDPVSGDETRISQPAFADPSEGDQAQSVDDGTEIGNQVASAPAESTADSGAVDGTGSDGGMSAGRVFGETDDVRIVVRARVDSFIQVRDDGANRMLVTRLLRAGDVYRVPDRPGLKLSTGNAGALEILVDGEPVPAIGGEGDVLQGVALDVERLRQGSAVSP